MTRIQVAPSARQNLDTIVATHALPGSAASRVRASLESLRTFPGRGRMLEGPWQGCRFILGPWSWMLIVYRYDEAADQVAILAVEDARSGRSATSS